MEKPKPPNQGLEFTDQDFEDIKDLAGLLTFLGSKPSGQSISHEIMEIVPKYRGLEAHDRIVKYIKFIAKFNNPALRRILHLFLIDKDEALAKIQKEENEKKYIKQAISYNLEKLRGMGKGERKKHMSEALTLAHQSEEEHPGLLEALDAAFEKFEEKAKSEPEETIPEGEQAEPSKGQTEGVAHYGSPEPMPEPITENPPEETTPESLSPEDETIAKLDKEDEINNKNIEDLERELEEIERRIAEQKTIEESSHKKENISDLEKIGDSFVEFCKKPENLIDFNQKTFAKSLAQVLPEVKVKLVFRLSSAEEPYFFEKRPDSSSTKAILINLDPKHYILPYPIGKEFDTLVEVFDFNADSANTDRLKKIIPAEVEKKGKRWDLTKKGQLL